MVIADYFKSRSQECLIGSKNFRAVQCSKFDGMRLNIKRNAPKDTVWLPMTRGGWIKQTN